MNTRQTTRFPSTPGAVWIAEQPQATHEIVWMELAIAQSLLPGVSADAIPSVEAYYLKPEDYADLNKWKPVDGISETVYDPTNRNCLVSPQRVRVQFNRWSGRLEVVGSAGLWRQAVATEAITAGSTGTANLWIRGEDSDVEITIANTWMTNAEDIPDETECFVVWHDDEGEWISEIGMYAGQWIVHNTECLNP